MILLQRQWYNCVRMASVPILLVAGGAGGWRRDKPLGRFRVPHPSILKVRILTLLFSRSPPLLLYR
jgi:hypothetical protein